jgi:hypothetical protein
VHDLPCHGHAIGRILGEQLVQDRRAGAREPEHEQRRADRAALDLRVCVQRGRDAQAVLEQAQEVGARERPLRVARRGARRLCGGGLAGARLRRRLLWRDSLVWRKPA